MAFPLETSSPIAIATQIGLSTTATTTTLHPQNNHLRSISILLPIPHPSRLPPRRRRPRPLNLDPPPLPNSRLPSESQHRATSRDAQLPLALLAPVPVLGVRGGFPGVDG